VKRATLVASFFLIFASIQVLAAAESDSSSRQGKNCTHQEKHRLLIRVAPGNWGMANPNEMLKHFPGQLPPPYSGVFRRATH
jgi:hypothetical protein